MKIRLLTVLLLVGLFLSSCASNSFSDNVECKSITKSLQSEISALEGYYAYDDTDIQFIFDPSLPIESCSIIYSASSEDIGEVGVLHADDDKSAQMLLEAAREYIEQVCTDKSAFVENYLPAERAKLDCADAKRFGNYVVFALLEADDRDAVFKTAEKCLK